jgi:hypothetical protein
MSVCIVLSSCLLRVWGLCFGYWLVFIRVLLLFMLLLIPCLREGRLSYCQRL